MFLTAFVQHYWRRAAAAAIETTELEQKLLTLCFCERLASHSSIHRSLSRPFVLANPEARGIFVYPMLKSNVRNPFFFAAFHFGHTGGDEHVIGAGT